MTRQHRGARRALNTVDRPPPREWICLVGGPTNTFNGWMSVVSLKSGIHPELTDDDRYVVVPQAAPRNHHDVERYVRYGPRTPPGLPPIARWDGRQDKAIWGQAWRALLNPEQWADNGWGPAALDAMVDSGWTPHEVESGEPYTHDLFWGNFAHPAARLYGGSALLDPAIQRPRPKQGDIVTFVVWMPGYLQRDKVDFDASPYNIANWDPTDGAPYLGAPPAPRPPRLVKPPKRGEAPDCPDDYTSLSLDEKADVLVAAARRQGVAVAHDDARNYLALEGDRGSSWFDRLTNSNLPEWEQRKIFDDALVKVVQRHGRPPALGDTAARLAAARQEWHKRELERARNPPSLAPLSDAQLNRRIMARRIGENDGEIVRRNKGHTCESFIRELIQIGVASGTLRTKPRPNVIGSGHVVPDVMVKVLFLTEIDELTEYVRSGTWSGREASVITSDTPALGDDRVFTAPSQTEWFAALSPADRRAFEGTDPEELHTWYESFVERDRYMAERKSFLLSPRNKAASPEYWNKHWEKSPNVDRAKIKITRLDYFGHASSTAMVLEYGWANDKGELPGFDVKLEERHIKGWFERGRPTTQDAVAVLWGCHLGVDAAHSLGPWLAKEGYFHEVIAADSSTDFHEIVERGAMPKPSSGGSWKTYLAPGAPRPAPR